MKKSNGSKNRLLIGTYFLFAILFISISCSKSSNNYMTDMTGMTGGTGGPGVNEVWIQNMAFNPSTITVAAGTKITWTNKDAITHTVTSDTNLFNSGNIGSNGTFSSTFSTAGTYSYHCSIHTSMTAKVVAN